MHKSLAWLLAASVLAGCSSGQQQFADLEDFMSEVQSRPHRPPEPLPEFQPYEPFAYSAAGQRSPFEPPVEQRRRPEGMPDVQPDPNRVKQFLEQFSLNDLRMVGTIERESEVYALIRDGRGGVHRVTAGDFLGPNHGEIQAIAESDIELEEIVPDGVGGWLLRSRTIRLAQDG
ncbi:MAG: pilus assembly protein PilP [Gammaproteobacteria bacterium]|nr:pilus assembly protein PilP [Gammaproteobacteria bacterium]